MTASTIVDVFELRVNRSGPKVAARYLVNNGWESVTWNRWWELAERLAAGFVDLGVDPGDRVALLCDTRFEWALIDIAILMCGGVTVPIFPSNLPALIGQILADCTPKIVVAEDPSQVAKLQQVKRQIAAKNVVCIEATAAFERPDWAGRVETGLEDLDLPKGWVISYSEFMDRGRKRIATNHRSVIERRGALGPDDLATIVYTSGTAASPKGVELTHENLVREVNALTELEFLSHDDVQLLFLPMAHIFARVLYLTAIGYGIPTAFVGTVADLSQALQEISPTFFAGVPDVFQKIRNRVVFDAHKFGGVRSAMFDAAYADGRKATEVAQKGRAISLFARAKSRFFDELVYRRIRELFGGNIRMLISGGASLPEELFEFYFAMGIPILEGFGLTETTAVATLNLLDEFRVGTVGRPLPGVEVTIAEDHEILIRGKTVMRGYHRDQAATRAVIDKEGWLRTGDLGEYDHDGFLKITGRKKDIIVTAAGKNIAPQHLEAMLRRSPWVDQAMVFGDGRAFVVALFTLSPEQVQTWVNAQTTVTDIEAAKRAARSFLQEHVDAVNREVAAFCTIKRFAILSSEVAADPDFMTPTHKLRRSIVASKCAGLIDSLYKEV